MFLYAEEGCILLSLNAWRDVHPSLVSIPFQVDYMVPYGILFSSEPAPETMQFLDIIRSLVSDRQNMSAR